ncbi:MAG TPA: OsmC family protein [Acidimicrobiia bacterium]|nr:OsmC family protein [Acidimicrobiia bacterium]
MTRTETRNGVDTEALFGALDAVKAQPEAAKFQFRARNQWIRGTHSRSTIHDFFGLGSEQTHLEEHTFEADHPTQLVAMDNAPTPAEQLLHALAACITAGIGNIAAARGIELTLVESVVTGDIDLVGLLGIDPTVRNGYQSIDVQLTIEGDGSAEELEAVVNRSMARSAVFDMLTNGTAVSVDVTTR